MKLFSYTNFEALFLTVDVDFCYFAYIKIFEIAKFVYNYCFYIILRKIHDNRYEANYRFPIEIAYFDLLALFRRQITKEKSIIHQRAGRNISQVGHKNSREGRLLSERDMDCLDSRDTLLFK